jgi:hypothetical protein
LLTSGSVVTLQNSAWREIIDTRTLHGQKDSGPSNGSSGSIVDNGGAAIWKFLGIGYLPLEGKMQVAGNLINIIE